MGGGGVLDCNHKFKTGEIPKSHIFRGVGGGGGRGGGIDLIPNNLYIQRSSSSRL